MRGPLTEDIYVYVRDLESGRQLQGTWARCGLFLLGTESQNNNNNNNIPRLYTAHTRRRHAKMLAMFRRVIRAVYPQVNI